MSVDPLSAERQRVLDLIDGWVAHYPEDVFPPLTLGVENSHDRIAAHAIRHALRGLREQISDSDALPVSSRVAGAYADNPEDIGWEPSGWFYPDAPADGGDDAS